MFPYDAIDVENPFGLAHGGLHPQFFIFDYTPWEGHQESLKIIIDIIIALMRFYIGGFLWGFLFLDSTCFLANTLCREKN